MNLGTPDNPVKLETHTFTKQCCDEDLTYNDPHNIDSYTDGFSVCRVCGKRYSNDEIYTKFDQESIDSMIASVREVIKQHIIDDVTKQAEDERFIFLPETKFNLWQRFHRWLGFRRYKTWEEINFGEEFDDG